MRKTVSKIMSLLIASACLVSTIRLSADSVSAEKTSYSTRDIVKMIKHCISAEAVTADEKSYYDMNSDGRLNIIDVILLKEKILENGTDVIPEETTIVTTTPEPMTTTVTTMTLPESATAITTMTPPESNFICKVNG